MGTGAAKQPLWEAKGGCVMKGCAVAGAGMGFQDDQDQTMEETPFGWWLFSWWMASMVTCQSRSAALLATAGVMLGSAWSSLANHCKGERRGVGVAAL